MLRKIEGRRRRGWQRLRWLDGVLCFTLFVTPDVLLFTLSALFTEPRVSKVQANSPEEDARSHRNCRYIYSLLGATEAITVCTLYSFFCGWPKRQSHDAAVLPITLWVEFVQACHTQIPWSSKYLMMHMNNATSDLSSYIVIIYKCRMKKLEHAIWAKLLSSHRWYHQLNRYEFEQTRGNSEGKGNLVCCSPWGHKESDTAEQLNNKNDTFHLCRKKTDFLAKTS